MSTSLQKKLSQVQNLEKVKSKNYLDAESQKRIRRRLSMYNSFIVARFIEGYSPNHIAMIMSVSEESIRSRIRKADLFGSNGKPGRPKKGAKHF